MGEKSITTFEELAKAYPSGNAVNNEGGLGNDATKEKFLQINEDDLIELMVDEIPLGASVRANIVKEWKKWIYHQPQLEIARARRRSSPRASSPRAAPRASAPRASAPRAPTSPPSHLEDWKKWRKTQTRSASPPPQRFPTPPPSWPLPLPDRPQVVQHTGTNHYVGRVVETEGGSGGELFGPLKANSPIPGVENIMVIAQGGGRKKGKTKKRKTKRKKYKKSKKSKRRKYKKRSTRRKR